MPLHDGSSGVDDSDIDDVPRITPTITSPVTINVPTGSPSDGGGGSSPTNNQKSGTPYSNYGTTDNAGSSGSAPITNCGNSVNLDKRIKIFRTHDKALWFMWIDTLYNNTTGSTTSSGTTGSSSTNKTTTTTGTYPKGTASTTPGTAATSSPAKVDQTVFTLIDPVNPSKSYTTSALQEGDAILFYTRTLNESFNIPSDSNGVINPNVFWCLWSDGTNLQPIKGIKYFDFWYDEDKHEIDLVFWGNVNADDLKVKAKDMYDSIRNPTLSDGSIDPKAQRVVFHAKGAYRQFITTRQKTTQAVGMFIFTKPMLLLNPGSKAGNSADPVVDEELGLRFLELQ